MKLKNMLVLCTFLMGTYLPIKTLEAHFTNTNTSTASTTDSTVSFEISPSKPTIHNLPPDQQPSLLKTALLGMVTGATTGASCAYIEKFNQHNPFEYNLVVWLLTHCCRTQMVHKINQRLKINADDSIVGETAWLADWVTYVFCKLASSR